MTDQDDRLKCRGCGQIHAGARLITLPDGRVVGNHSEEYRAYCEAVYVAGLPTKQRRNQYLWGSLDGKIKGISQRRSVESANRLRADVMALWQQKPAPAEGEK